MSLSKNQIKLITSLQQKKYRQKHKLFVVEGVKVVRELLESTFRLVQLFVVEGGDFPCFSDKITVISALELKKMSSLKTPNMVIALFEFPDALPAKLDGLVLMLDEINDPGNLGTIIRLCDWFGVEQILCSMNTVDCYNPKVIQATMGSIARVQVKYVDLIEQIQQTNKPVFIADMNGDNIYKSDLPTDAILIMGNEANGISEAIRKIVTHKLTIPQFGGVQKTESLNVATATAILLSEFKR